MAHSVGCFRHSGHGVVHAGATVIYRGQTLPNSAFEIVGLNVEGGRDCVNLGGGLAGPFSKLAHLVGHHVEATPGFSRTDSFNDSVEGGQIGLVGDSRTWRVMELMRCMLCTDSSEADATR